MYLLIGASYVGIYIYIYIYICVSCFHCQTAGPIRLKFSMRSTSTRVSVNKHVDVAMGVVSL